MMYPRFRSFASAHDTALMTGSAPFYQVIINGKLFKAYAYQSEADAMARKMRAWGMDAIVIEVGGSASV
jgi:hypothetical protein